MDCKAVNFQVSFYNFLHLALKTTLVRALVFWFSSYVMFLRVCEYCLILQYRYKDA